MPETCLYTYAENKTDQIENARLNNCTAAPQHRGEPSADWAIFIHSISEM